MPAAIKFIWGVTDRRTTASFGFFQRGMEPECRASF
jgi:hypothetical protein